MKKRKTNVIKFAKYKKPVSDEYSKVMGVLNQFNGMILYDINCYPKNKIEILFYDSVSKPELAGYICYHKKEDWNALYSTNNPLILAVMEIIKDTLITK